ncbi:hypothetical protein RN001_013814 [Aquatica leii]|uniref:Uncharacterized protein n=1 Tax=Aquatica leii TaxID=1421715 RepID=A0AAN7SE52_9COLE|nr:hypothetical protein RN001_013814 [Aquatica leii]
MVISKRQQQESLITLRSQIIERVEKYCFLGSWVNAQWDQSMEIKSKIKKTRTAWTITEPMMRRLEAFEIWVYRRILCISWVDHISNEEVLRRLGKQKEISYTIKKTKTKILRTRNAQ